MQKNQKNPMKRFPEKDQRVILGPILSPFVKRGKIGSKYASFCSISSNERFREKANI